MASKDRRIPRLLRPRLILLFPLFASSLSATGCGDTTLESAWPDREIKVDGHLDEWGDHLVEIEGLQADVGVLNDGRLLYLCFVTNDPALRDQVLSQGFELWVDPTGQKQPLRGLKYPLGLRNLLDLDGASLGPGGRGASGRNGADGARSAGGVGGLRGPRTEEDRERLEQRFAESLERIGILEGGRVLRRMPLEELQNMDVAVSRGRGSLVYELALPLQADGESSLAAGASAGESLMLGLRVGGFDAEQMQAMRQRRGADRGGRGGKGGPGGMGGGGGIGRMGGGRGMRGGPMRAGPTPPEPIEKWVRVKLAARS